MYLGIDVGTSEVKVLLLNDSHQVIGVAGATLEVTRPLPGHSEQDPQSWWMATQLALATLRHQHPIAYAAVKAIGLSGQMHGAVLLDKDNLVLRPAILWNDVRSAKECLNMMDDLPNLPQLAGSLAMPGFTAPKLQWVARHEPEIFAKVAKVLLPKDYVRFLLTGDWVSDMSDASGTMWLDIEKRAWSPALLALTRLSTDHMPTLLDGSEPSGTLSASAAQALGLAEGIVVAGGAGDNAASAIGMGAVEPGEGFLSLGTSGVLFVVTPTYQPNAASATHAFCHAIPGRWHQMSVMLSAASCLQWAAQILGMESAGALEAKASQLSAADRATAPIFLPYLSGERTPHNDAKVRGSFHGLANNTEQSAMAYAVIEGVTFGLTDGLHALQQAGSTAQRLSLVGGGARSEFWAQQLASSLNIEIVTHAESTAGGALGAARLGWLATGGTVAQVCNKPEIIKTYQPDIAEQGLLAPRYERFRALYQALQSLH
jgi:xylulokinase